MLVKIANLRRLALAAPAVERVTTFNAAENGLHARHQHLPRASAPQVGRRNGNAPSARAVTLPGSSPQAPAEATQPAGSPVPPWNAGGSGICWRLKARLEPGIGHAMGGRDGWDDARYGK